MLTVIFIVFCIAVGVGVGRLIQWAWRRAWKTYGDDCKLPKRRARKTYGDDCKLPKR